MPREELYIVDNRLEAIARSYDKAIDLGRRGIDQYQELPEYITNDPDYPLYEKMRMGETLSDSASQVLISYLAPKAGMKFIDLGCCLNLMFCGYDQWPSTYYGVDISSKTIELLQEFVKKNHLRIGSLFCGSMHETPFENGFFDIGACIGSLEYFEKDFVEKAIIEMHRILKPDARFVLDVPDLGSPECRIAMIIEDYLGRTDQYDLPPQTFEKLIGDYFTIVRKEKSGSMIQYFMRCKSNGMHKRFD